MCTAELDQAAVGHIDAALFFMNDRSVQLTGHHPLAVARKDSLGSINTEMTNTSVLFAVGCEGILLGGQITVDTFVELGMSMVVVR